MAKAYWVVSYRAVRNPEALAAYARVAAPAVLAGGGRFVVRGNAAKAYEAGQLLRTVVVEFESLAQAVAVHDSPGYQAAVALLGEGAVERDFRIVEAAA